MDDYERFYLFTIFYHDIVLVEVMKVLTEERHRLILDLLHQQDIVKMQDIVDRTGSSESTIRRDLVTLENQNFCLRVHGGAKRTYELHEEPEMEEKSSLYIGEKKEIAQIAVSFIKDQDIIFLDAGTTTFQMIPLLKDKNILVVTNGVPHASLLTDYKVSTILLGGKIKMQTKATIGSDCLHQIAQYRFNKAFLGMNGVDYQYGYTTPDTEEAVVKRMAISQASKAYVLADSSKFKKVSFAKVADLDCCDIITNKVDTNVRSFLEEKTNVWEEII